MPECLEMTLLKGSFILYDTSSVHNTGESTEATDREVGVGEVGMMMNKPEKPMQRINESIRADGYR